MTGDQRDFVLLMALCLAIPALLSWIFGRFKPSWSQRRRVWTAALPLPLAVWALCAFVFFGAVFASKEDCGVDACGMAMAFSMIIASVALLGLFVGAIAATVVARLSARPHEE